MLVLGRNLLTPVIHRTRTFSTGNALPAIWKKLESIKTMPEPNIVKKQIGEITEVFKKEPNGDISKTIASRLFDMPPVKVEVADIDPKTLEKLNSK